MIHSGNVFGKDEQCTTTASPAPILSLQKFGKFNRFFLKKWANPSLFLFILVLSSLQSQ